MSTILPNRLLPGNTIGVISVSAPEAVAEPERYERGLQALRNRGYTLCIAPSVTQSHGYMSASEEKLANELLEFFANDAIHAIICAGGGTNANRLLRHLDYELIAKHPKIFMGMSNPSVLLNAIQARTGLLGFHGPVVVWNFGDPHGLKPYTAEHLWPVLECRRRRVLFRPQPGWTFLRPGSARGRLLGGNLGSLEGLLGTSHEPNWDGAIFFWEDVSTPLSDVDMILTHFRDAGVFERIVGMVVGTLVECEGPEGEQSLPMMLLEVLRDYGFPVLMGVDFGHTDDKLTLPIGALAEIDSSESRFEVVEPVIQ